ncbi:hypothetical protein Tco_1479595, partial [Tanacetum coccineum]
MHANKSFNRNPANHRLYHALMEALIEDENTIDKGVADIIKDHKGKHNDDEDDDDEDPPAGPNQGKKTKWRRTKESESSKKPSTTKETPKGKAPSKGSKTGKSAPAKEPVKEPIAEVVMDDAGKDVVRDDDQPQDTSKPKTTKTLNPVWFTQPPKPPTPEQPWFNQMLSLTKDPLTFNDLMATPIDFSKYVLNRLKIDNPTQDILLEPTYNLLKATYTSRDRYPFDLSKPLPLQGHPCHLTIAADYFFYNDLKYLKSSNLERTYTTSITKTKAARYNIEGIEDMVPTLWSGKILGVKSVNVKKLHEYGHLEDIVVKRADRQFYKFKEEVIKKRVEDLQLGVERVIYEDLTKQKRVVRANKLYKFSDGTLKKVQDELHHRVRDFRLEYNKEMPRRKWTTTDRKRSELMVELIDKQMRERRIIRNLKRLVGARELEMDYKL